MHQHAEQAQLPKISIRDSGIHGRGVYADESIRKGQHIIEYVGEKIPTAEGTRRELLTPGHTFIFILDEEWDIDGGVGGNDSRFINHSCSPNTDIEYIDGRIWIVAGRDIAKGDELTYDYAFDANEPPAPCRCGTGGCRGYINEYDDEGHKNRKVEEYLQKKSHLASHAHLNKNV